MITDALRCRNRTAAGRVDMAVLPRDSPSSRWVDVVPPHTLGLTEARGDSVPEYLDDLFRVPLGRPAATIPSQFPTGGFPRE